MCIKRDPKSSRPHHRAFAPCFPTPWMLNARVRAPLSSPHEYYAASYWAQKGGEEARKDTPKKQTKKKKPHKKNATKKKAQKGKHALALGRQTELQVTRQKNTTPKKKNKG